MTSDHDSADALLTVSRGLQVLRAFRGERAPLSNAEIVARTGLPKSTVSRLTTTLMFSGFLQHASGGRQFELSTGPLGIGQALLESSPLVQRAQPFMQALADRLNVSVALAMPDQLEMLYVTYCSGRNISTLRLGVGSMLPMASTAIGHGYLWGLPVEEREALIARMAQRMGAGFAKVREAMGTSFSHMADSGCCLVVGGYQRDTYGIGCPIRVGRQGTVMGLNCGAAVLGVDFERVRSTVGKALMEAAPELEHLLQDLEGPF
ncbi:IclR family transcriptional regulator [Pseudomonas putida]|uniref:IclR family transcriptional regulator n=1 Tax=Pseudomonas TaxID=286 RepID=UPI001AEAE280|nr:MULTISPECIES: IclR family transcriptional regulator [Pseudomonas]MBP2271401.1 DNA-binding IclR family transcriptional regulator [Pseudomonas sp. BP6]MBP2289628.1 DNA-binding IclR family transcriptional regulator [Pseudomonas sp. BP7]MCI1025556.1 IclR family transcriptional regulator [Pseudomonas putida]HDS1697833.1 IclR family transcriptional regulator [Pseudomonas putida]HDS1703056.1 IclR family transcriptional regulator [Pseudomonas putida]